jgi:hypothetical protein
MSDESLPVSTRVQLAIVDLREVVSDDKAEVMVSGNIMNWGNRPTTAVTVQVSGLDRDGRVVVQVPITPSSQTIAPGGGLPFASVLPNDPTVVDYHVEAIGFGVGTK